jgi:hypothetical protein
VLLVRLTRTASGRMTGPRFGGVVDHPHAFPPRHHPNTAPHPSWPLPFPCSYLTATVHVPCTFSLLSASLFPLRLSLFSVTRPALTWAKQSECGPAGKALQRPGFVPLRINICNLLLTFVHYCVSILLPTPVSLTPSHRSLPSPPTPFILFPGRQGRACESWVPLKYQDLRTSD